MKQKAGLALLDKSAASKFNSKPFKDMALGIGTMAAGALTIKAADAVADRIREALDKRKYNKVISYAQKKHPELKQVPKEQLAYWMDAFHTLAPKMATNKELASTMLVTAHNYGNNIDLATAKLIADTGEKASKQHGSTNEFVQLLNAGGGLAPISNARKANKGSSSENSSSQGTTSSTSRP